MRFATGMPVARDTTFAMSFEVTASCNRVVELCVSSVSSGGIAFSSEGMMEYRNSAARRRSPSRSAVSRLIRAFSRSCFAFLRASSCCLD